MNPAAIFGMSQLVQVYNWFSAPSSSAIPAKSQAVSTTLLNNESAVPVGKFEDAGRKCPQMPLEVAELIHVLKFFEPEDLGSLAVVSKTFKDAVWYQWKSRCQEFFPGTELDSVLPATLGFENNKECFQFMHKNILDESFYARYIGDVEPASQSAKANFLKRRNQPDPCDPTTTIGREYVLLYIPSHIEIDQRDFSLSKADDPNDPEAPRLIRRKPIHGVQLESTTLKVAVTFNNIVELFKHPKTGNPSLCELIWDSFIDDHGNKRIPAGCVSLRRDLIGRNLYLKDQKALATKNGVELSQLLPRILFNFMEHSRSREVGVYPDGEDPRTIARTSMNIRGYYLVCGNGGLSGLSVNGDFDWPMDNTGVAVVLPADVQALGH